MTLFKICQDYNEYIKNMTEKDFMIVDPPWNYNNKAKEFTTRTEFSKVTDNVEFLNYLFLNVKTKLLFLWITSPLLGYLLLSQKYGVTFGDFEYKQILVWSKTKNDGFDYEGQGFWFKNSCEFIVLFAKHGVKPIRSRILNICREKATKNAETQKPKIFESFIFRELYNAGYSTGVYLFSGSFSDYDISIKQNVELVDIKHEKE